VSIIAVQLKKIGKMFEQILVKLPNTKSKENPFSSSQAVTCKQD
jgi:hypothetical protein